jgi:hypothetical protein
MAKLKTIQKTATAATPAEPASNDIDDIFAKTPKASVSVPAPTATTEPSKKSKKKKSKSTTEVAEFVQEEDSSISTAEKRKSTEEPASTKKKSKPTISSGLVPEKQPEPEVISDPSKVVKSTANAAVFKQQARRGLDEEDQLFVDSRGEGPRTLPDIEVDICAMMLESGIDLHFCVDFGTGRKTEEGFMIFKEAELDIDPEAGGKSHLACLARLHIKAYQSGSFPFNRY